MHNIITCGVVMESKWLRWLYNGTIQSIMSSMQNLQLSDSEDLNVYKDKLENLNLQLSWVGQGMPEPYLIHLAQHDKMLASLDSGEEIQQSKHHCK